MSFKKLIILLLLGCCFGLSFFFIKLGLESIPPFTLVTLRLALATLFLYPCIRFKGLRIRDYRHLWRHFLVMGSCACTIPFCLITYAEQTVPSGLAGLVNGITPIFTILLAHYSIKNDQMTPKKIGGVFLGILGLTFVVFPQLLLGNFNHVLGITPIVVASIFYAIGMVHSRKYLHHLPPFVGPFCQLVVATLIALPIALIFDPPFALPSLKSFGGVLELALIGTVTTFTLYYRLIAIAEPSYLSLFALIAPLVSILLGTMLLGEHLSWNIYMGGSIILLGLAVSSEMVTFRRVRQPLKSSVRGK